MLAIRMKRLGRKGYPVYRMIVQDSHRHPSSGKIIKYLGSYNPHTKETNLDKESIEFYLGNGAQPSGRAAKLMKDNKISLPDWYKESEQKSKKTRNADKLRKNQPKEEPAPEEPAKDSDSPAEPDADAAAKDVPAEEPAPDADKK